MTKFSATNAIKQSKRWHQEIKKKVLSDPKAHETYLRVRQEIDITLKIRKAREKANISQETVAHRMHTTRTAVSRLESSSLGKRHSPSIQTLIKYAEALGYALKINLVPLKGKHPKTPGR